MSRNLGRFVAFATTTALLGGLLGALPAQAVEPDIDPPIVSEFTATPNPVDLSDGDVTMTVKMRVADPSGLKYGPIASLRSLTTSQSRSGYFRLVDGTNEDGTWQTEIEIPAASARGAWTLRSGSVTDNLGNSTSWSLDVTIGPGGLLQAATPRITGEPVVDGLLTVTPGKWGPGEVSLTYQWLRDGSAMEGETDGSYRLTVGDLGREISVRVSGSKQMYDHDSRTSDPVTVRPAQFTHQGEEQTEVSADGAHHVGQTLTAHPGVWTPQPTTLTYQWLRDEVAIAGETATTYQLTVDDLQKVITVRVTGSKPGYLDESRSSYPFYRVEAGWLTRPESIPISGDWSVGGTVTVDPGAWGPGAVSLSYQWNRNGEPIAGATASSHNLTGDDAGKAITVKVTGSKPGYETVSLENGTYLGWASLTPPGWTTPLGTPETGQTLTADPGVWSPDGVAFTYAWYRNGQPIMGANGKTYELTPEDVYSAVQVFITGSKTGYTSTQAGAAAVQVRPAALVHSTPKLSGVMASGQTLTVDPGTWSPGVTFRYQWLRNGEDISGATKSSYTLTSKDVGKQIGVYMTGEKRGYTPGMVNWQSHPAAKVMKAATPKISGTLAVGSTLKVSKGSWTSSVKFAYQWLRDGQPINKATRTSYKLTGADAGRLITVRVTGKRSGYETAALASTATTKTMKAATPKISGTKKVGKTLSVRPGSWLVGTTFTYQWYANGKQIKGATGEQITLAKAQKKKRITVKVTGSQPGHATIVKTSAKTAKVK